MALIADVRTISLLKMVLSVENFLFEGEDLFGCIEVEKVVNFKWKYENRLFA